MPVDNTKTGLSNYTDLKQNDPIQNSNPLLSNSNNYFKEVTPKSSPMNYSELKSVIKPTAKNNILISNDPILNDINRQANYLNDIKQLPLSEVAVKYSKSILPYKEEFNDFYNNNTWFKSGVDEMLNTGNIAGVENLFNSTMAANQTNWQKIQKGFGTMGTELMAQSFGGIADLTAMVCGAIGLTFGQVVNPFLKNDYFADWSNNNLMNFNPDYTSKIRTGFNRGGLFGFNIFNNEYWNGDTSLGINEKDNNKIWLTNEEMNNPWKISVGNISQNIIGGMGPTLGFLLAGGLTAGASKGLMAIGANEIGLSSRTAIKQFVFKSGEFIKNNTGVILGTLEGHVEGYDAAKQFIKTSKDQIDANYNNVISNYFYDTLLQKYNGDKTKVLDVLQYLGEHNFDNASLLSSGINPDSLDQIKRQAEYMKNTSLKEMDKQALQTYAITFGINSVINGIANKYMVQPLFNGVSSKLKSGVHFKFRNKDIKLGGSKIIDGPNGIPLIDTKKNILQKIWKNPLTKTFVGLSSEGAEEFAQEITNAFAEGRSNAAMNNLYADLYNKENEEYFKKQSNIISAGFSELWDAATDTKRALFAGTLGVLNAGLMVHPSFGNQVVRQPKTKVGNISKKIGQVVQLNWSPKQLYQQAAAENKRKDEFTERWNTWASNTENSQTLSLLNAAVAQEEFLKGKNLDINTSLFDIKNKKLQQFFTSISLARQAGIEKEYISALKNAHSWLNTAMKNPDSSIASSFIDQAINNGLLSKENVKKPEEVEKSLNIIFNNTKNMLDMIPKISKLDSQISNMYGDILDSKTKSLLIYGHLQRDNWISRKKELENITGNSSISNIATSIDSKMNNISGNFDWELFSLGNSGTEAKNNASKIQSDLENTINKFTKAKESQYDKLKTLKRGTKEYQDTLSNYSKASAAEKYFKKNLSKFKKTYNHVINTTKSWDDNTMNTPFSFTLNDFMNLSNTQKAKVLEKYEKNNLPKQQMEIIKNFIDEVSIDFEKNNKTSYVDAVKDLAKIDEGLTDLNNNLLRYQTKPEEIQKDSIKAEVKQVVNNINDKVSSKINELSSMETNDLLIEFDKIKNSAEVSDFKPSNQKNEDDIFNVTLFSELKKLKDSNNSEIGNKLNTIKEIKKDGDVITAISNDEETNDFEKQFLTSAYTFLTEKNIDPATMSVVREKLYDNNAVMLHEMFDEFFSYFSEIGSSFQEIVDENPEIEDKHIVDNTIPQKYISNVPTPFTLNGNYMKLGEFEDLLSKLPDYVKEANSNKIKEDTTTKVEDSSEELLNTINVETENTPIDEVIVEDVIDPNESVTRSIITPENVKPEVNPDKITISSNDIFAFDIDEKSEFYWSSGVFKNDSILVDYFRKHNTLSFLQSGRLKYFITGKRPAKDSIKDSRNASKLFFMVDRSLEKDIYDKMISEGKTYDARQHTSIIVITEDKNGTILIKGKKYQVVTAIAGGVSKNHPYFNTFYDKYILSNKELTSANQPEDGIVLLTDELNNPIFTNAVTSIPIGKNIASSNTNTKGHKTYVNNTSNSNENGPYDKFPLIEINAELEHGIPGAEKTKGIYRIFDDSGNKIDDDWTIVEKKSTIVDTQDNLRKMSFAFLQHRNSTSDAENIYLYSHSLESIDKDDFINTLKGFLASLNDSNINNETKEELHKQLRNSLTNINSRSKYSGAKTISLTRDQVLLFLQGVLKVKTNNTTIDNSIIISQGDNFDNINILKKYILISTEYLKIDKGAIFINKPNPSENTGRIKIANWVKIFDPIEDKTEDIETIQKLADVITAELLTIPDVKFNIDYADLKEVPGETSAQKSKREQNFRRLLSDGLIYTSGSTVKRPNRVVRDISTGDYTYMYDIPMIPPIDIQKAVAYDHSTKTEKTVQSNDVVNEHNIKEKTTIIDNSNNEIDPISEVVITENASKDNTKSIFNRIFNTINKLIDNTQKIKLNEDGSKYVDENGIEYDRVTTVTKDDTVNILNPVKSVDSLNYGTLIDEFIRDFFNFKLKDLNEYTFSNEIVLTEFVKELTKLKEYFLKNGETVISKELRLADPNLKLAGTTDIVTVDNEGKVRIYDIKTMNGNNFTQVDVTQGVSKFESTTFGKSKKQKYQEQLSLYRIILNNTEGILADELFIIPINIQYEEMMDNVDSIEVLPLYKIEALNEVGPYNMSGELFVKPTVKEETKTITPSIKPNDPIRDISLDFNPMEDQFMKTNTTMDNDDKLMSNHKEEFEYLKKVLPQFFSEDGTPLPEIITIVEGLINISENIENIDDPDNKAYGKYTKAHITLSNTAKRGTVYHEAMHYILDIFFTKTEKEIFLRQVKNNPIFEQAIKNVDSAEEVVAEIFRVGLNDKIDTKETIYSSFFENKFIKKVFFRIRTFFGLQPKTIQELFYRVNKGFYANKSIISEKTDININTSVNNDLIKLDNKIQNPEINVKKLLENGQITFTNEDGDPCAAEGIKTHSSKGSIWKIIKEFSGKTHEEGGIKTKISSDNENITIEVENSELKIQNDNGDIAIIPSKYAIEVKDMIAGQCWNCVNAFVEKLPELQ